MTLGRGGMTGKRVASARRAIHQFPAAVRATIIQRLRADSAKRAFKRADERARLASRQVHAAPFAIGTHVEHQAATLATASQIRSTTSFT